MIEVLLSQSTEVHGSPLICVLTGARVPLEVHLHGMTPEERALWDRYVELVEAAGPSEMIVNKSRIAFRAPHRNFTGGFFKTRRLELFFDLPEPVPERERDGRFRAVWQHSKTVRRGLATLTAPEQRLLAQRIGRATGRKVLDQLSDLAAVRARDGPTRLAKPRPVQQLLLQLLAP